MINELTLKVFGGLKKGPVDAFEYFAGEDRDLTLQIIDAEIEAGIPIFFGDFFSGAITLFATNGAGGTTVTSNAHGRSNGDKLNLSDVIDSLGDPVLSFDENFTIFNKTANTFDIDIPFVAGPTAPVSGVWQLGPADMKLTFPGSPTDVIISVPFASFDSEDRSMFSINLVAEQTTTMISGFIKFTYRDKNGNHRVAYAPRLQAKLLTA